MTLPTRRALLQLLATLPPGMMLEPNGGPTPAAAQILHTIEKEHREAALAIGEWLWENGVNAQTLKSARPGRNVPVRDIRASFRDDALIDVDGVLLPSGFCRFCLELFQESTGKGALS